jgi:hypothetical protein
VRQTTYISEIFSGRTGVASIDRESNRELLVANGQMRETDRRRQRRQRREREERERGEE